VLVVLRSVAEAFYSQIPLVVISADRPQNKIDIGDGQTIRQENVLGNHCLYNANLREDASAENDNHIQMALHVAATQKGPVHINAPFEEPLYEIVSELKVKPEIIDFNTEEKYFKIEDSTVETWSNATKKLVLVGELFPNSVEQRYLDILANDPSVASFFFNGTMIKNRVVLSTNVPMALSLFLPSTRSPSQCPGISRVSTSSGLSSIRIGSFIVVLLSAPRRTFPL
jgi:hypothetical protein